MTFKECILIVVTAFLETCIIMLLIVGSSHLICLDHSYALHFCNINNISPNLSFTVNSIEFANILTILFITIQVLVLFPVLKLVGGWLNKWHKFVVS